MNRRRGEGPVVGVRGWSIVVADGLVCGGLGRGREIDGEVAREKSWLLFGCHQVFVYLMEIQDGKKKENRFILIWYSFLLQGCMGGGRR